MGFLRRLFGGGDSPPERDHQRERELRASRPPIEKPLPAFAFPIDACSGASAIQRLAHLREQGRREGFTAVLLGDDEDVSSLAELPEFNVATPQQVFDAARQIDVAEWFSKRRNDMLGCDEEWEGPGLGDWPAKPERNDSLLAQINIRNNRPKPRVYIARLPTRNSWEVFAYLHYGEWNDCPMPQAHVAVARSWHERFGAEVVAITHDTVEFEVARPPSTREEAVEVAWEHYWYCTDIVDQGIETIHRLAASLLVGRYWYFWWD